MTRVDLATLGPDGRLKDSQVPSGLAYDFDRDFQPSPDESVLCTAELQAAVNAVYADGGGTIRFSDRVYRHGAISWPGPTGYLVEPVTICFEGPYALETVPFCPGSGGNSYDTQMPTVGTIFWGVLNAGESAFFGNIAAATQGLAIFRNCQVLAAGNPQTYGINAGWLTNLITENVIVGVRNAADGFCSTGNSATGIPEPLNLGSIGIVYPGEGNGGTVQARNTVAFGYGIGATHSEHFIADNLTCFKNKVGLQPRDGWHAATYNRVSLYWNTIDLQSLLNGANQTNPAATKPVTRLVGNQIDSEETDEAVAWYKTALHIDDPYNRFRGRVRWHRMKAATGIFGPLDRNGAVRLDLAPVGSMPRATLDVVGFAVANGVGLPSSFGGLVPVVPRGAWSVDTLQAKVSTLASTDTPVVWPVGDPRVLVRSRITMPASGARNIGICLNYVDASNYLFGVISSSSNVVQIQRVSAGAYTVMGSAAFISVAGATYEMVMIQRGARVELWIDGTLLVTWAMASADWSQFSPGLSHGLYAYTGAGWESGLTRWNFVQFETPGVIGA